MAIDLPIRGARRFCTLRLAVAHETPRSIRTRKHSRSPACEPARHFEWNRDRHFWLSSRALVFENSGLQEPLAIRNVRRVLTASGGLVLPKSW